MLDFFDNTSVTHIIDVIDNLKYPLSQLLKIAVHFLVLKGNKKLMNPSISSLNHTFVRTDFLKSVSINVFKCTVKKLETD